MAVTYNEGFFASVSAKLARMKNIQSSAFRSELSSDIAEIGAQIASAKYDGGDGVAVSAVKGNDGHSAVAASGSQVAYIEFGTGIPGESEPYRGNLPTVGVPVTGAWQYYYPNALTKRTTADGVKGWFHTDENGTRFYKGEAPGEQMWETARELQRQKITIAKEKIQKYMKGGNG